MKNICVITGSRAEYGLLSLLIGKIKESTALNLQIIATGSHLSSEYGMTVNEILRDNFHIDRRVEMLLSSNTETGSAKSIGLGIIGMADAFDDLKPDMVILLGDRFEIFAAATTAMIKRIPIAHLHGGEITLGSADEFMRHAITKMSHLHFVACDQYKKRVIQLGEEPSRVFNVGALGIDNAVSMNLLSKAELEIELGFKFQHRNLMITYHPDLMGVRTDRSSIDNMLVALSHYPDIGMIFTMPNSDAGSNYIADSIERYCSKNNNTRLFESLGHKNYLSCLQYIDGVIGNSSSGIIEAPFFKIGTINIGDRQNGRVAAKSIIHADTNVSSILNSINILFSENFQKDLKNVDSLFGYGGATEKIVQVLEGFAEYKKVDKKFHDL